MKKNLKRIASALASLALAACLTPAAAFAEPPVEVRTVQWLSTQEEPAYEEQIQVNGQTYGLTHVSVAAVDTQTGSVEADHTEVRECWPADLDATVASFPETWAVDTDDYAGDIPRTSVTYEPVEAQRTWEVNATQTYSGLPSNDVAQIAQTLDYTNDETGHELTLNLASISWNVAAVDERGLPKTYAATCIYRGTDTQTVVDHYVVTAVWRGDVPAKKPVTTYEATLIYESPAPEPARGRGEETPVALIAAIVAAAAVAGGFFAYFRRRDVRVCRKENDALRVVAKIASKRANDGTLVVELPAKINVGQGEYALILRKDKASGGLLRVTQFGITLCETAATEIVWLSRM